jgi:hypothetical protein
MIMVNTTEIISVYNSLYAAVLAKYMELWQNNQIDAETYASMAAQASSQLVQISAELVQKQEQLDKDTAIKEEQVKIAYVDRVIKDKQAALLGLDNVMKTVNSNPTNVYEPKYEEM